MGLESGRILLKKEEREVITFRLVPHSGVPGIELCEIWDQDTFIGAIYPTDQGIKVVSKFIIDDPEGAVVIDRSKLPPIPAILINIKH